MFSAVIQSQGCKLNQVEGEALAGAFRKAGFSLGIKNPQIIIINTCTVTSKSDQKARRIIRKALRNNPGSCVLVTGCYAQLEAQEIKALEEPLEGPGGRLFVVKGEEKDSLLDLPRILAGAQSPQQLCALVKSWSEGGVVDCFAKGSYPALQGEKKGMNPETNTLPKQHTPSLQDGVVDKTEREDGAFHFTPEYFSFHTRGFLKIQDGCNRHCTYCRARLARGNSRSLDKNKALEELQQLEMKGYAEVVLAGLNITEYEGGLGGLLEFLLEGTQKINIRLSSLEPDRISGKLAGIICQKRIQPHFHLAVQSGSEKILKKMGRFYNPQAVEQAAALFRAAKGDPFLACDIIAGFPGETESDFEKTMILCQKIDFAWIHVFPYSKRQGTEAFNFPEAVPEKETAKRVEILQDLAWKGRQRYINRWLGREVTVLVEKSSGEKSFCRAVSDNYLKLLVRYKSSKAPPTGSVLRCRLTPDQEVDCKNAGYDAVAEEI